MLKLFGNLHRALLYTVVVVVAVVAGYLLATPTDPMSMLPLGLLGLALVAPLILRFRHDLLIATWNVSFIAFFLPGRPTLAMLLTAVSLFVAALHRAMLKQPMFLPVRSLLWPAAALGAVILATAMITGGIRGQALGSGTFGAKRYITALFGIAGLFAVCTRAVPPNRVWWLVSLFVLGSATAALGDLAYVLGITPLFLLLDSSLTTGLAVSESSGLMMRYTGLCWAGWATFSWLFLRYGLSGILDLTKPWRLLAVGGAFVVTMAGGYRTYIVLAAMLLVVLFFLEGLYRTRTAIFLAVAVTVGGTLLLGLADRLPLTMQRAISFLPVQVDPVAKKDADGTLDWRIEMWKVVVKEIPKYFWVGKGFSYDGTDYYLTLEAVRRGIRYESYEFALVSGNYHHGILTLIIPFGIWGVLAFGWLTTAGFRVLWLNYRFSPPSLLLINRYLLAFFVVQLLFFLTLYGQFDLDLPIFTGLFGVSVAVNGGIRRAPAVEATVTLSEPEARMAGPVAVPTKVPFPV